MLFVFLDFPELIIFRFEVAEENIKIIMLVILLIITIIRNLKDTNSKCIFCLLRLNLINIPIGHP